MAREPKTDALCLRMNDFIFLPPHIGFEETQFNTNAEGKGVKELVEHNYD